MLIKIVSALRRSFHNLEFIVEKGNLKLLCKEKIFSNKEAKIRRQPRVYVWTRLVSDSLNEELMFSSQKKGENDSYCK